MEILKLDLQITTDAYDAELRLILQSAERFIAAEGVSLDMTRADDAYLPIMYAAYLYRKRRETDTAMPRMLRWALNNRIFQEKAGRNSDG